MRLLCLRRPLPATAGAAHLAAQHARTSLRTEAGSPAHGRALAQARALGYAVWQKGGDAFLIPLD